MLPDLLITLNGLEPVKAPRPCKHLAERTGLYALTDCPSPKFTPVYACPIQIICSPFGAVKDKTLVKACIECDQYENGERT